MKGTRTSYSPIAVPAKVKQVLGTFKAEMSRTRRVTWAECLDTLGQWYFLKPTTEAKIAALEAELAALRETVRKVAENSTQAVANITAPQGIVLPPPAPRKLCPPPRGAVRDERFSAVVKELKTLFEANGGIPKLLSAEEAKAREL